MLKVSRERLEAMASADTDPDFPSELARQIKMLVLDVDGVLTDGGLYYGDDGLSHKRFDVQDGMGIKLAQRAGIEVVIISGMRSMALEKRGEDLGIEECHGGRHLKLPLLQDIMDKKDLGWENVAFVGDDMIDLPILCKVGLPLAVANAQPEVKAIAAYTSPAAGGNGAVRQMVRQILIAQGVWPKILSDILHMS